MRKVQTKRNSSRVMQMTGVIAGVTCISSSFAADPSPAPPATTPEATPGVTAPPSATDVPPLELLQPDTRHGLFRLGPFDFRPRISTGVTYDDNLALREENARKDFIISLAPGLTAQAVGGNKVLTIDYSPTFEFFTKYDENDAINHSASLNGTWPMSRLALGVSQDFNRTSGGVVEVGDRVTGEIYSTSLTSKYDWTGKTSLEVNARQRITAYERYIGFREWSNDNWINYQYTPKLNTGFGLTFGYTQVENPPAALGAPAIGQQDQWYEQALLRAIYSLTGKLDLNAAVGGEWRQYSSASSSLNPVFSIGGTYHPLDGTTISLEAHRRQQSSAVVAGQNYEATGFTLTLRQRVLERWFASLTGGYENTEYSQSAETGVPALDRSDDYFTGRLTLEFLISERWSAMGFYQYRQRDSSNAPGFENNQVGLQTAWRF